MVMNACACTSREQGNLFDLLWSLSYLQPFMCCSLQKGHFHKLPWLANTYTCARCWAQSVYKLWNILLFLLLSHTHNVAHCLSFIFLHPISSTYTRTNTPKDLQCSKSYIRGSESSIKGMSGQLYSGVKTALDRNPSGLSPASVTMQHTSEAQQAALQSYYMVTGALSHTHRHKQQHIYVHGHI